MKRLIALLLLCPTAALAHPGDHATSFLAGLAHPISGLDHILAMLAVGVLAMTTGGRARWALPLTFVATLLAGGAMGIGGVTLPAVEPMILASVLLLGVLIALQNHLPLMTLLPVIAIFGIAHGHAHGTEGQAAGLLPHAAGFILSTAALHLGGLALGWGMQGLAARSLGLATAGVGLALVFA